MPAFAKKLSADELEGLVDLVLALAQPEGAEAPSAARTSSPVGGRTTRALRARVRGPKAPDSGEGPPRDSLARGGGLATPSD